MMKWMTRIPTHDNDGNSLEGLVLQTLLHEVRNRFDGYSFDGPGWGAWTDDDGMVYEENSYVLTVLCERARYLDARNLVIEIGRGLGQKAMYFEVRDVDGVEIITIEED